jgi:hypothetical protein
MGSLGNPVVGGKVLGRVGWCYSASGQALWFKRHGITFDRCTPAQPA